MKKRPDVNKSRKPSPQDLAREAANREGEARRAKDKASHRANAEKQKRYRESMKAQGYRAVLSWENPLSSNKVKVSANIHKSSLEITGESPEIQEALNLMMGSFLKDVASLPRSTWSTVYKDTQELLKPLGRI
jgi:hypothetical protein